MGLTMAEKILARKSGRGEVSPGEIVEARVDVVMLHDVGTPGVQRPLRELGAEEIAPGVRCVIIPDHFVPAPTVQAAENLKLTREFARRMKLEHYYELGRGGICHQVMVEKGHVRPGDLIVAPDSHATTYGACGAFGTGLGVTDVAIALATGRLWFRVPESVRVTLEGKLAPGVSAKDVSLFLLGEFGESRLIYKSLELGGPVIDDLGLDGRLCMADMALEMGVKACLMATDGKMLGYLRRVVGGEVEPIFSDPDARYEEEYRLDLTGLEPMVSAPHSPANVKRVTEVEGIKVDQAFLGSCTNGRMEDLRLAASMLFGRRVHPEVRLLVTPASHEIYSRCLDEGLIQVFTAAGAVVTNPSCGACVGGHLGLLAGGETCISSSNRNFRGRMGSKEGQVYLASPATVVASALAGKISDPRQALGVK